MTTKHKTNKEKADNRQWFVRMKDGTVFGPVHTRGLRSWAREGRVLPDDEVSEDNEVWQPARDMPELGMETYIERPDGTFSGPYHPDAIQPLISEGKVLPTAKKLGREDYNNLIANKQLGLFEEEEEKSPGTVTKLKSKKTVPRKNHTLVETADMENSEPAVETTVARETPAADSTKEDGRIPAPEEKIAELKAEVEKGSAEIAALTEALAETRSELEKKAAEFERLKSERRENEKNTDLLRAERDAIEKEADGLRQELESLKVKVETGDLRIEHLLDDLDQARKDYQELLVFSNNRDAEYNARLNALSNEPPAGEHPGVAMRRISALEEQLVAGRRESEKLREQLERSNAELAGKERPLETEIKRIQNFAETAIEALKQTLAQEREDNDNARAISAARQEALQSRLDQLRRALSLAPGEATRAEEIERRNDRLIAKLQQDLEAAKRQHANEISQAAEKARKLEMRASAIEKREIAARDQLALAELRSADYESIKSQLQRRESALLAVENEFDEARQQWQSIENTLMQRIEELESGAAQWTNEDEPQSPAKVLAFEARPWMRLQK